MSDPVERAKAMDLLRDLERKFQDRRFDLVREDLDQVNVSGTSTLLLVGLLRYTFCARHMLGDSWPKAVERISEELTSRGEDTKALLHGLRPVS